MRLRSEFIRAGARQACIAALLIASIARVFAAADDARDTTIVVTGQICRQNVPKSLFGFNVPWVSFQRGYWRNGAVRREIIEWLVPFEGAVYRYPGGDISNWFDWRPTVRRKDHRGPQYAKYGQFEVARFGFGEYVEFVKEVGGVPLVTVNLLGLEGPKPETWDAETAARIAADWVTHAKKFARADNPTLLSSCSPSFGCNVVLWELGNELDVGKTKWTGSHYVSVATRVAQEMRRANDSIVIIPQTNTHPWNQSKRRFSRDVITGMAGTASMFSIHAYYGVRGVPRAMEYIQDLESDLAQAAVPDGAIAVTEHARWPWAPGEPVSPYGPLWLKTGDVWGALDAAEFILSIAVRPRVMLAAWHALGAEGPWQLFYVDKQDRLAPNVVYWALRVLREGWRANALTTTVAGPNTTGAPGTSDVSALMMAEPAPSLSRSLLVVNRASSSTVVRLKMPAAANRRISATQVFLTGDRPDEANTPVMPSAVQMQRKPVMIEFDAAGVARLEVPKLSVSAFLWNSH